MESIEAWILEKMEQKTGLFLKGKKSNLEIRKYFSARKVRAIRAQTDLSQAEFAKRAGLKRRTYQNYEEGQRIPSRLIVNAMQTVAVSGIYCIRSHRRL